MANNDFNKPHFFLDSTKLTKDFTAYGGGEPKLTPEQNRLLHSKKLRNDLATVSNNLETLRFEAESTSLEMPLGIQVEVESFPDIEMAVESLAYSPKKIDLLNVKTVSDGVHEKTIATIFIPDGQLIYLEKKLDDYLEEKKNRNGDPIDNQKLIDSIQSIRRAVFSAIWSDDDSFLPNDKDEPVWWEVWLSTPNRNKPKKAGVKNFSKEVVSDFTLVANPLGIDVSPHSLRFPEHTIIQVKASQNQLSSSSLLLSRVSEIRAPKVTAEFFDVMPSEEQEAWSQELLERLNKSDNGNEPYICIIDTGVNVEHPLLKPFTDISNQLTITADEDPTDKNGHGTGMAGLAMWGDLTDALATNDELNVSHKLESVKVLNHNGDNKDKPLGLVTSNAVSEVENRDASRDRIFSMSLSANTGTERGRASSWSSTLDSLASDYLGEREYPRLFTVCAGNTGNDLSALRDYPNYNVLQDIHDPAQAWNVITVGAYTNKVTITESNDYQPLARRGGLSPYSTTSAVWDKKNTPIKPDVVFEGGNIGQDQYGCAGMHDLNLLSTNNDFSQRHFQTTNATSAATALAARFAAQVKAEYPTLWPETVRALMIHSAGWTDEMYDLISANRTDKSINKGEMAKLTRIVGFGVPNLEKAVKSSNNSLSLVIQDELQPFHKTGGSIKTKDMHLHDLPWPKETLQSISEANVELTITLSYFVEPNPSSRNILDKYGYASHQLRFAVKHHEESERAFQRRINAAEQEGDNVDTSSDSEGWCFGIRNRHRGSIHKDIWTGSAASLAERGQIAIYPAKGWWRTRTSHERYDSKIRYSLVVSLSVPEVDVDIYSEVESIISIDSAIKLKQQVEV